MPQLVSAICEGHKAIFQRVRGAHWMIKSRHIVVLILLLILGTVQAGAGALIRILASWVALQLLVWLAQPCAPHKLLASHGIIC